MIRGTSYTVSSFLLRRLKNNAPLRSSPEEDIRDLVLRHWNLECGLLSNDLRQEGLNNYASRTGEFVSTFELYKGIQVTLVTEMGNYERGFCMSVTKVYEDGHPDGKLYLFMRSIAIWVDRFIFGG